MNSYVLIELNIQRQFQEGQSYLVTLSQFSNSKEGCATHVNISMEQSSSRAEKQIKL